MHAVRLVDAFCASCDEITEHRIPCADTTRCECLECGSTQAVVRPLEAMPA